VLGAAGWQTGLTLWKAGAMSAGEQLGAGRVIEDEAIRGGLVEQHHVAVIPESDRHGRPRDQFTLWFAANANVVNFTLGVLAIEFGLNLFWALVGIVVGNVLGMLLTALHAWQGPRLGVPQMIQSRGQFGFHGASFILIVSIVLDIGYLAASQVLQGSSLHLLASGLSVQVWIIIVTIPSLALAIFGYKWIHQAQKVMTAIFAVVIVIALIQAASYGHGVLKADRGFHLSSGPVLIAVIGLFFMNMLSWAIYVSDYSRYLPRDVSFGKTFWAIFGGNVASTTLFAGLGAWIASLVPNGTSNPLGALATVSGLWIMFFMGISQIPGDTLNAYTGMLAFASLGTNNSKLMAAQNRQAVRLTGIVVIFVIGTILACLSSNHFYSSFENFIGVLLFFFVPWSAINLVDYYLVRRGRYDVASFFTPDGIYGGFQWWACLCYVITLAVQVPFLDQLFFVGSLVKPLGGADISWIVGFGVASLLYLAGAKRFVGVGSSLPVADPVAS
jgi:NCS1 family nucleobase:cation symporter-1